jgi:hypothetical protein
MQRRELGRGGRPDDRESIATIHRAAAVDR